MQSYPNTSDGACAIAALRKQEETDLPGMGTLCHMKLCMCSEWIHQVIQGPNPEAHNGVIRPFVS